MVQNRASVVRRPDPTTSDDGAELPGLKAEIPIAEIVPGDLIGLSAGDMIPADVRLLTSKDLFVSQSAMSNT